MRSLEHGSEKLSSLRLAHNTNNTCRSEVVRGRIDGVTAPLRARRTVAWEKLSHITTLSPGGDLPRRIQKQPIRRVFEPSLRKFLPEFIQINQAVAVRI